MRKDKFIDLVRNRLGASSVDRLKKADPRTVELAIAAVMNTVFYEAFRKDTSNLDTYTKTYENVAVSQDPDTEIYYSTLPANVVQFPIVGDGVVGINEMKGEDVMFVPLPSSDFEMMYGLEVDLIDDVIKYTRKGNIVEYVNFDSTITAVRMDLVVDFTEWDDDEDVPIPSGQDINIMNKVVEYLLGKPTTDILNNQNEIA